MENPAIEEPNQSAKERPSSILIQGLHWPGKAPVVGSGQLLIRTLGRFQVRRNGLPIENKQWGGKRQKLLLKSIVVHGAREVPTEIVIDNIWPDSKSKAAQRNLKVALHRLRRVFEPDLDPKNGSSYVHLKDNLISLDRELCKIDVDEFLQCRKESRRRENRSDLEKLRNLCHRAVDLYQGDFLPEEPYEPWIEMKRLALRDEFINALFELVKIYRDSGALDEAAFYCQKVIQVEPNLERATRELMKIYAEQGRRGEALKAFENLERCLKEDIGMVPDKATLSLREDILCRQR